MLSQLEIDQIVNESREADEGPTLLVRRVEAKVRKTCEVACAQALVYAAGAARVPDAWIGPEGQIMLHAIYEAWAPAYPEAAKLFRPLYALTPPR